MRTKTQDKNLLENGKIRSKFTIAVSKEIKPLTLSKLSGNL